MEILATIRTKNFKEEMGTKMRARGEGRRRIFSLCVISIENVSIWVGKQSEAIFGRLSVSENNAMQRRHVWVETRMHKC